MSRVALGCLLCVIVPFVVRAQEKIGYPVYDRANSACKEWGIRAHAAMQAKQPLPPRPFCTVIVPGCPADKARVHGICAGAIETNNIGYCFGLRTEVCGEKLEGYPDAAQGIQGGGGGGGSPPAKTPPALIMLPPITVEGGEVAGILPAFGDEGESEDVSGEDGGASQPTRGSAWARPLIDFFSGLAGLFSPTVSSAPIAGGSPRAAQPSVVYTPVYVNAAPVESPARSPSAFAPRVFTNTTFPAPTFDAPSLNDLIFEDIFEPERIEYSPEALLASLGEDAPVPVYVYNERQPPLVAQTLPTLQGVPEPLATRLAAELERGAVHLPQEQARVREPALSPGTNVPLVSSGSVLPRSFPESFDLFEIALRALPPISSIVSVPNISFELARAGDAAIAIIDAWNEPEIPILAQVAPGAQSGASAISARVPEVAPPQTIVQRARATLSALWQRVRRAFGFR